MHLFIGRNPRCIVISSNGYNLMFKRFHRSSRSNVKDSQYLKTPTVVIGSVTDEDLMDANHFIEVKNRILNGLLGLITVDGGIYIVVISGVQKVGFPRWKYQDGQVLPSENIYKILDVDFYSLDVNVFDHLFYELSEINYEKLINEHPCGSLKKLFNDGSFFYSREFDISNSIKNHTWSKNLDYTIDNQDTNYIWNKNLTSEIIQWRNRMNDIEKVTFDLGGFLIFIMRGFCKTTLIETPTSVSSITLISRISIENKPNIFDLKGINDDGKISNFIETEIIVTTERFIFSYTQISCNIPLFWEIVDNQLIGGKRPKLTKSPEHAQVAFDRHFDNLESKYGIVTIVNLIKPRSESQRLLSMSYKTCADAKKIKLINFDCSSDSLLKSSHKLLYFLESDIYEFGAFVYDTNKGIYIGKQTGILRISSFDSLKKVNSIEKLVCQEVLELATKELKDFELTNIFAESYERIWSENYYWLNRTYSKNVKNNIKMKRTYIKLFGSRVKLYDPLNSFLNKNMKNLRNKYTFEKKIKIFAGTFNISGKISQDSIHDWIFPKRFFPITPPSSKSKKSSYATCSNIADIYVIGLEEVIELTPGHMLYTDPYIKQYWEKKILHVLNSNTHGNGKKFVCLWSNQLGGILLMVFMNEDEYIKVKHIEGDVKKTGLGGMASNKGAVAVSFKYSATKFCVIASHLAAGLDNVEQRHIDYKTINKNIRFSRGLRIKDHDAVIWMGDFNYRILMTNDQVRKLIIKKEYNKLLERDQLNQQMIAGATFPYYHEMEIKFPPTYKFDPGTKNYDTSEKLRIPAWTDRILSRGEVLKQLSYGCAEDILFSDHRPVYAIFKARVTVVDEKKKEAISKEVYERIMDKLDRATDEERLEFLNEGISVMNEFEDSDDNTRIDEGGDMTIFDINDPNNNLGNLGNNTNNGNDITSNNNTNSADRIYLQTNQETKKTKRLPPPSSDLKKWWIGGGKQVKVSLNIDAEDYMLNPKRSVNPFVEDDEEPIFIRRVPEDTAENEVDKGREGGDEEQYTQEGRKQED
ncbi:hypothetical protein TBLA_0J01760 [Henningerozyma blattae CBS 6284]|uniref:phosphoinositide 5-phosphatase n=1 Tax=Henningerozyma blattae (strain ATCC 34711 / CBS 6284 / DSM 70876 / NBRC 10599 / NRRL Y-10934 / UCD 77-7) TaxID=1071380 RepID=I2H9W8_HENB6|nr:hypothetical protein TBLA_0J01760 [Tetrapisispora blattae CBS 6284]CCH63170.1 hypothetical protein TBLA_0J01760 [Tetrapisispora blattae CBS 6284]